NSLSAPEPWHLVGAPGGPGFLNFWTEVPEFSVFGKVGFYKDHEGVVHLKGAAFGGSSKTVFQLPPGFRPAAGFNYVVPMACSGGSLCASDGVSSGVIVGSSGEVEAPAGVSGVFLNGISFLAES